MARVVVFKSPGELEHLRDLLYGDPDAQRRGLTLAKAYNTRAPLPPSIHITCLVRAAMHADTPLLDIYAIRLTYAMALVRFVNEILDAAQAGKAAVPLHALATDIDLPNSFVELRHAATHEDLPSIYLLRDMANRALDWLWHSFWRRQISPPTASQSPTPDPIDPQETDAEDRIKELLRQWRRAKRADAAAKPPPALVADLKRELALNESEFLSVVMTRNILVPAGSGPLPKRGASVVSLWGPLFTQLGPQFRQNLASRIVSALSLRDWPIDPADPREVRRFPMLAAWAEALAADLGPDAISSICSVPRPWNAVIAAKYASAHSRRDVYDTARKMAQLTGAKIADFPEAAASTPGWTKVADWTPRPLGV